LADQERGGVVVVEKVKDREGKKKGETKKRENKKKSETKKKGKQKKK
jgi:hypothetical protein